MLKTMRDGPLCMLLLAADMNTLSGKRREEGERERGGEGGGEREEGRGRRGEGGGEREEGRRRRGEGERGRGRRKMGTKVRRLRRGGGEREIGRTQRRRVEGSGLRGEHEESGGVRIEGGE